jgi:hypothetical protein
MQFIFFVPPNEELEGTLHPQKFGCTPKNEGKRVHVPPDEKTWGHAANAWQINLTCITPLKHYQGQNQTALYFITSNNTTSE